MECHRVHALRHTSVVSWSIDDESTALEVMMTCVLLAKFTGDHLPNLDATLTGSAGGGAWGFRPVATLAEAWFNRSFERPTSRVFF